MRIVLASVRIQFLELVRLPSFVLPLVAMPVITYVVIGLPIDRYRTQVLLGYVAFTILGSMMFQFGVGIASTRNDPWTQYTLTIPGKGSQRAAALLITGALFALLFCIPIAIAGAVNGVPAPPTTTAFGLVTGTLVGGAVVHGLLGIALGYWLPHRGAVPIATVLYFPLSYIGGLFGPIGDPTLRAIQPWLPTGSWMHALGTASFGGVDVRDTIVLAGFGVVFAVAAATGYRRVERTTYR